MQSIHDCSVDRCPRTRPLRPAFCLWKCSLGALLSSPALDVRLPTALQVLQVPPNRKVWPKTSSPRGNALPAPMRGPLPTPEVSGAKEIELRTADASWMACLFSFFLDAPHPPFALNANTKEFSLKKLGTGLARSGTTCQSPR